MSRTPYESATTFERLHYGVVDTQPATMVETNKVSAGSHTTSVEATRGHLAGPCSLDFFNHMGSIRTDRARYRLSHRAPQTLNRSWTTGTTPGQFRDYASQRALNPADPRIATEEQATNRGQN